MTKEGVVDETRALRKKYTKKYTQHFRDRVSSRHQVALNLFQSDDAIGLPAWIVIML